MCLTLDTILTTIKSMERRKREMRLKRQSRRLRIICKNSKNKTGNFFKGTKEEETWEEVEGCKITAGGKMTLVSEEGKIEATSANIQAKDKLTIKAKKSVEFKSLKTMRTKEVTKRSWFGICSSSEKTTTEECQMGSVRSGQLQIISEEGNIKLNGTKLKVENEASLSASKGMVELADQILKETSEKSSRGFLSDGVLGFSFSSTKKSSTNVAGAGITAGSLKIAAQKLNVNEGYGINVSKDMEVNAEEANFQGAELDSQFSHKDTKVGLDIKNLSFDISHSRAEQKSKHFRNQKTNVGGTLTLNTAKVNFIAANVDADSISGQIETLNVVSKQDEKQSESSSFTVGLSLTFVGSVPIPYPSKFEYANENEMTKSVLQSSGFKIRQGQ